MFKRLSAAVLITCLATTTASAQGPGGRLYFDLAGNGGDENAPHPGATAKENAALIGPGPHRLYIYWEFGGPNQKVLSPNFDVEVDGGTITRAHYYNNLIDGQWRWGGPSPRPPVDNPGSAVRFKAGSIDKAGLRNDPIAFQYDRQFRFDDGPFGSTLLGYVDVSTPTPDASVWLRVGPLGIAIQGGTPDTPIRFGFGDDSVRAGSRDRSAEPEAGGCEPCDANCDGAVDAFDIEPFIDVLFNGVTPCGPCAADANGDGQRDAFDIEAFIDCLFGP